MITNRNKSILALYATVFFGYLLMFAFILPSCDVFIFNRDTVNTLSSAVEYSLNYGNGRFLGNFLAVVLSYHFPLAGFLIACTLTLMVYSLNCLLFNNKPLMIMPIALFVLMPCKGMVSECYYMFCAFLNYVLPVAIIVFCIVILRCLYKNNLSKIRSLLLHVVLFILMFSSCLFSENTTIVLAAIVGLVCLSNFITNKRLHTSSIVGIISVIFGGAVMVAIPLLTQTSSKMDGYRAISTTVSSLVDTMLGNFVAFATFFATFIPLVVLLSAALIFTLRKNCEVEKITDSLTLVFLIYPISCIIFTFIDTNPRRLNWIYLLQAVLLIIYLVAMFITLFKIKDKAILKRSIAFIVLIMASVGPMMIVNQYGYRTYYTTFIIVFFFAVYLLKEFMPTKITHFVLENKWSKKILSTVCACVFVFSSVFLLMQTMYNFAFYSVRADDILRQLETSDTVEVPMLPCYICSMEDEHYNIVSQSIGISLHDVQLIDLYTSSNSDEYIRITQCSPVTIIKTVIDNLECFDPAYFDNRR